MSKLQRILNGVTTYPAVGKPCAVSVYDITTRTDKRYWLGHVWISEREGSFLRPRETVQAANLDAINAVVALGKVK